MLTEREYRAMKIILSISTDPEVKKLLRDRVGKHEQEIMLRDISRRSRIKGRRVLKGIALLSADDKV